MKMLHLDQQNAKNYVKNAGKIKFSYWYTPSKLDHGTHLLEYTNAITAVSSILDVSIMLAER